MKHLLLILLASFVITACEKDFDIASDNRDHLLLLEAKYNVKIQNDGKRNLSEADLSLIENEIIELTNRFKDLKQYNGKEIEAIDLTQTKSTDNEFGVWYNKQLQGSEHFYNLAWLNISASLVYSTTRTFTLESWITGVTVYSYEQKALTNSFDGSIYQLGRVLAIPNEITFSFTALLSAKVLDAINITTQSKVSGVVKFSKNILIINCE